MGQQCNRRDNLDWQAYHKANIWPPARHFARCQSLHYEVRWVNPVQSCLASLVASRCRRGGAAQKLGYATLLMVCCAVEIVAQASFAFIGNPVFDGSGGLTLPRTGRSGEVRDEAACARTMLSGVARARQTYIEEGNVTKFAI